MPKSKSVNKEKRRKINDFATEFVARATGLEPVTYGLKIPTAGAEVQAINVANSL